MTRAIRTFAFALAIVVLSSSLPARASEPTREPRMRDRSSPILVLKKIVKRVFGITTMETITIPRP